MSEYFHQPVLLEECIEGLRLSAGQTVVDATFGGGGHAQLILDKIGNSGKLICLDQDQEAIARGQHKFKEYNNIIFIRANFLDLKEKLAENKICRIDAALFDLGVSSYQIDDLNRGFSWKNESPLDMRMDQNQKITAQDILNGYSETELSKIIKDYGEERYAKKISRRIAEFRKVQKLETSSQLKALILKAVPGLEKAKIASLARVFQAIRIAVNNELEIIAPSLEQAVQLLCSGGRLAVISFHSLEDRIVKQLFNSLARPCTCPSNFPKCVCGKKPILKIINKKPILPTAAEIAHNVRARSAKLRIGEKI